MKKKPRRRRAPGAGRPPKPPEDRASTRVAARLYGPDVARFERLRATFAAQGRDVQTGELVRIALHALEYLEILAPTVWEEAFVKTQE